MAIDLNLIDKLLADYKKPEDIIGENGLLKQLTKALAVEPKDSWRGCFSPYWSQYSRPLAVLIAPGRRNLVGRLGRAILCVRSIVSCHR